MEVWQGSAIVSNLQQLNLLSARQWRTAASLSQGEALIEFHCQEVLSLIKAGKFNLISKLLASLDKIAPFHNKALFAKLETLLAQGSFVKAFYFLKSIYPQKKISKLLGIRSAVWVCMCADLTFDEVKNAY